MYALKEVVKRKKLNYLGLKPIFSLNRSSNAISDRFNVIRCNHYLSPKFPMPGKTWNFSLISGSTAVVTIVTLKKSDRDISKID